MAVDSMTDADVDSAIAAQIASWNAHNALAPVSLPHHFLRQLVRAARAQALDEAARACKTVAARHRHNNSRTWLDRNLSEGQDGASDCETAIRALPRAGRWGRREHGRSSGSGGRRARQVRRDSPQPRRDAVRGLAPSVRRHRKRNRSGTTRVINEKGMA